MTILKCNLVLCYIASVRPFADAFENRMVTFNEATVTLLSFFLLLYSDSLLQKHDQSSNEVIDVESARVKIVDE